jgi:hypothetical protein
MTEFSGVVTVSRDYSSTRAGELSRQLSCPIEGPDCSVSNLVSFSFLDLDPKILRSIDLRICRSVDLSWSIYGHAILRQEPP